MSQMRKCEDGITRVVIDLSSRTRPPSTLMTVGIDEQVAKLREAIKTSFEDLDRDITEEYFFEKDLKGFLHRIAKLKERANEESTRHYSQYSDLRIIKGILSDLEDLGEDAAEAM